MNENEVEGVAIANLIAADEETIVGWVYRWNTGALAIRWDIHGPQRVSKIDMVEYGLYGPRLCECACVAGLISYKALRDVAAPQQSVIDLLEAVIPAIVTPLNEDGSVINVRAVLAPPLETGMRSRKRCG